MPRGTDTRVCGLDTRGEALGLTGDPGPSVETSLDAADTSVRATELREMCW